jgi:uncharacterized MAPEG superfamily protein
MSIAEWCVLVAGIMPIVLAGVAKGGARVDNHNPRDWAAALQGYRRRAFAAHNNAFEAFPLFAVAVVLAEANGTSPGHIDALALAFIAARIGHAVCYMADWATPRSILWALGWFSSIALFTLPIWR